MTPTFEWFQKLCVQEEQSRTDWAKKPCIMFDASKDPWTVATNARVLVALRGRCFDAEPLAVESARVFGTPYLLRHPATDEVMPLAVLKEWAGECLWREVCPQCKGNSGRADGPAEEWYCDFCDSEGTFEYSRRDGRLLDWYFDRALFAQSLLPFEDAQVRLVFGKGVKQSPKKQSDGPLYIEPLGADPQWRVVVMPLDKLAKDVAPVVPGVNRIDPAWLAWNDSTIPRMLVAIAEEKERSKLLPYNWSVLSILADALEDAGCCDAALLGSLRDGDVTHTHGSWVVDALGAAIGQKCCDLILGTTT